MATARTKAVLQALAGCTADDWADLIESIEAGLLGDLLLAAGKSVKVNAQQVVGGRLAAVADPAALTSPAAGLGAGANGTTFSGAQCDALRADVSALRAVVILILTRMRVAAGHGLIAD